MIHRLLHAASHVQLMYETILSDDNLVDVRKALSIEKMLEFSQYEDREKESKTKEIRDRLISLSKLFNYSPIFCKAKTWVWNQQDIGWIVNIVYIKNV